MNNWTRAPEYADLVDQGRAKIVHGLAWLSIVAPLLLLPMFGASTGGRAALVWMLPGVLTSAVALFLLYRGHLKVAAWLVVGQHGLAAGSATAIFGASALMSILYLPLIPLLAAVVLGWIEALVLTALITGLLLLRLVVWADASPPFELPADGSPRFSDPAFILLFGIMLGYIAFMLRTLLVSMRTSQQELRASRRFTDDLIRTLGDAVFVAGPDGLLIQVNDAALRLLEADNENQLIGLPLDSLIDRRPADDSLLPGESRSEGLTTVLRPLKTDAFPVILHETRIEDGVGRKCRVAVCTDISDLVEAERFVRESAERAEAASRAKSEFLANMSHELRTPLNGVLGMADMLLTTTLSPEQTDLLDTMQISGRTLLNIINDILDFSKIEAGRLSVDALPFDLRDCIEDSLRLYGAAAWERGLDLCYRMDEDVPELVIGDAGRLQQVLVNLVGNAVKFTEHGEVVVAVSRSTKDRLVFNVRDTGIGIEPQKQVEIFRAFEQQDGSITRRYGGTGLGLTISAGLVHLMGGDLNCESELGRGSVFQFDIDASSIPTTRSPAPIDNLRGRRVGVVEPRAASRAALVAMMVDLGLEVFDAPDIETAEDWLTRCELLLLSARVPDRSQVKLPQIPVVLLTGPTQARGKHKVDRSRYATTVLLPAGLRDLRRAVSKALEPATDRRKKSTDTLAGQRLADLLPLTILLVEDNAINRKVADTMLRSMGYSCDEAIDGRRALEKARENEYDLILMDSRMPVMNGIEATLEIRKLYPKGGRPYIVALTAHVQQEHRQEFLDAGADDFLGKPFDSASLFRVISRIFGGEIDTRSRRVQRNANPPQQLIDLWKGLDEDIESFSELVHEYIVDAHRLLQDMRDAVTDVQSQAFLRAAHTLRGSSGLMGLSELSQVCALIEQKEELDAPALTELEPIAKNGEDYLLSVLRWLRAGEAVFEARTAL